MTRLYGIARFNSSRLYNRAKFIFTLLLIIFIGVQSALAQNISLGFITYDGANLIIQHTADSAGTYEFEFCLSPGGCTYPTITFTGPGTDTLPWGGYSPIQPNTTYTVRARYQDGGNWSNSVSCTTNAAADSCTNTPPTDTPTSTHTSTPSNTPTDVPPPSNTPTLTATYTSTVTETLSSTATPSSTPTATFTLTYTETSLFTDTSTPSPTATQTTTNTLTPTLTVTYTSTVTETPSSTATATVTLTPTGTSEFTDTPSPSPTATHTPTSSLTPTFTLTPTITHSFTVAPTSTPTYTYTPVVVPSLPTINLAYITYDGANLRVQHTASAGGVYVFEFCLSTNGCYYPTITFTGPGTDTLSWGGFNPIRANTTYRVRARYIDGGLWSNTVNCTTNSSATICGSVDSLTPLPPSTIVPTVNPRVTSIPTVAPTSFASLQVRVLSFSTTATLQNGYTVRFEIFNPNNYSVFVNRALVNEVSNPSGGRSSTRYNNSNLRFSIPARSNYQIETIIVPYFLDWNLSPRQYCADTFPSDISPFDLFLRLVIAQFLGGSDIDDLNQITLTNIGRLIDRIRPGYSVSDLIGYGLVARDLSRLSNYVTSFSLRNRLTVEYNGGSVSSSYVQTQIDIPPARVNRLTRGIGWVSLGIVASTQFDGWLSWILQQSWGTPWISTAIVAAVTVPLQPIIWGCNEIILSTSAQ